MWDKKVSTNPWVAILRYRKNFPARTNIQQDCENWPPVIGHIGSVQSIARLYNRALERPTN